MAKLLQTTNSVMYHVCEENNTDNNNFVFSSQVNNNYEKSNVNPQIGYNRNDIYDFNFAQNSDDDCSNSVKPNGTGLFVDLNRCTSIS